MLVIEHDTDGALGFQINRPFKNGALFSNVMSNLGLDYSFDIPLYVGGQESLNQIYIVHTMDWYSSSTRRIAPDIGLSNDYSVLIAISQNQGPNLFRPIAGFSQWGEGHLDGEMSGKHPWTLGHTWSSTKVTVDLMFESDGDNQWKNVIAESAKDNINKWFSLSQS